MKLAEKIISMHKIDESEADKARKKIFAMFNKVGDAEKIKGDMVITVVKGSTMCDKANDVLGGLENGGNINLNQLSDENVEKLAKELNAK